MKAMLGFLRLPRLLRAGLAIPENGLELKRRQIKKQHGDSEVTFLLETFKGNSPKVCFIGFAIAIAD
jgi:hypothetical protein